MEVKKGNVKKLCSFYVSQWHLTTMLLPYISNQIEKNVKIATVLENNINENVKILVNKLKIKNKDKILSINWNKRKIIKYTDVSKIIKDNEEKDLVLGDDKKRELLIIVQGSREYIEEVNKYITKYLEINKNKTMETNITIINCYEIVEFNGSIVEILDQHDKILNTSGEREINDIFSDYVRKERIG